MRHDPAQLERTQERSSLEAHVRAERRRRHAAPTLQAIHLPKRALPLGGSVGFIDIHCQHEPLPVLRQRMHRVAEVRRSPLKSAGSFPEQRVALDQAAVDREVVVARETRLDRLTHDAVEELAGQPMRIQAIAVVGEDRRIERCVVNAKK